MSAKHIYNASNTPYSAAMAYQDPPRDCPLCPRLVAFREENRIKFPQFHNAPVNAFGPFDAELLVVGLAPGLKGANATGRPFTGDYAGDILYASLKKAGLASGDYDKRPDDGITLHNCRITNGVRCVPPQNKPETAEIKTCNAFLQKEMAAMPNLKMVLSLGSISHQAVLRACGLKLSSAKFSHGAFHEVEPEFRPQPLVLADSYHTSRYNLNTGVLTEAMFDAVLAGICAKL
ncbi:MAG: uracil-DNA glycosylase [Rickettsiales bacterium]